MEITASHLFSHARFSNSSPSSSASSLFPLSGYYQRKPSVVLPAKYMNDLKQKSVGFIPKEPTRTHGSTVGLRASAGESSPPPTTDAASAQEKWILEPIGDGDTRHIGSRVEMPGPFEIASNEVTVGRLPERAAMVIPVATVSGLHARIQKKGGNLLITDLDSTNGTFVDDRRLSPGVTATVSSGSCITFGDTHLAMFRAFKLENTETANEPSEEQSQEKPVADAAEEKPGAAS